MASLENHKSISERLRDAFRGVRIYLTEEVNWKASFVAFIIIVSLIYFIHPSYTELLIILVTLSVGLFIGFMNMIIEKLCDLYSMEYNPLIRDIKDLAAGISVIYSCIFIAVLAIIYIY